MELRAEHPREQIELTLPAEESAVADARRAVEGVEALGRHPEAQFALRLLISELFANGVKYGRSREIRLALDVEDERVRVEITDGGDGFDASRVSMPGPDATSGRGLALLDAHADRWGVTRTTGNQVWFELSLGDLDSR